MTACCLFYYVVLAAVQVIINYVVQRSCLSQVTKHLCVRVSVCLRMWVCV